MDMDESEVKIRDKKTGLIYLAIDMDDVFFGRRPGRMSDVRTRIPRARAVPVNRDAVDEPVKPERIPGGRVTEEDLERVRREKEGEK
jgi:hypothetical protein